MATEGPIQSEDGAALTLHCSGASAELAHLAYWLLPFAVGLPLFARALARDRGAGSSIASRTAGPLMGS